MAMPGVQTTTGWLEGQPDCDMLMHEHLVGGYIGSQWDATVLPDLDRELERLTEHLSDLRARHGLGLIVDAAPAAVGRNVEFMARLAAASGVRTVACTGFYTLKRGGIPYYFQTLGDEDIEGFMGRELTEGVARSGGIRCGVIKLGSSGMVLEPAEERVFRCAARVAARTGTAIITHTDPDGWEAGNPGLLQLETLVEAGAHPERIAIGHAFLPIDRLGELVEICRRGAFVAFDRFGLNNARENDRDRLRLVAALADAGYSGHILLSHDWPAVWIGPYMPLFAGGPGMPFAEGYGMLRERLQPEFRAAGLADAEFGRMLRHNPWRLLAH